MAGLVTVIVNMERAALAWVWVESLFWVWVESLFCSSVVPVVMIPGDLLMIQIDQISMVKANLQMRRLATDE